MTIAPTMREPLRDVKAQIYALSDPAHPKDAVWISDGTPFYIDDDSLYAVHTPHGVLYTNNPAKAEWFRLSPTQEALAAVLGYIESKSAIDPEDAVVVQAADRAGAIITEMACSIDNIARATEILRHHGDIIVAPLAVALARRAILVELEG